MPSYERLDYGSPDGSQWGGSADLIAFYGATPQARYSANLTQVSTRAGEIRMFAVPYSTAAHSYSTSAEETVVASTVASDSCVVVNRSSTTPGIVMANARVTAADSLGISMMNVSTGTVVPVSTAVYQVIEFRMGGGFVTTAALTPVAVAASTTAEQTFTVSGAMPGMAVAVNKPTEQTALGIANARVTAASTVAIAFANISSAAITPTADETYTFALVPTMRAASPVVQYGFPGTTVSGSCGISTTTEFTTTLLNLNATDYFVGHTEPVAQAGIFVSNGRINSSGVLGIAWANVSSGALTPTSSVMYGVTVLRPETQNPMTLATTTFPGTTVAASSTIEITSTVNGITTSSLAFVNKLFHTANIGVANCRVSAANTLAVALFNTATTATAVASGSYRVAFTPRAPALGIGGGVFGGQTGINSTCAYMSYQVAPNTADAAAQIRNALSANGFLNT